MSGGSFNYLCHKDADEILERLADLERMSGALAALGYAGDAAAETQELLLNCRQFFNRAEVAMVRLYPVWHGLEWWHSGDTGEEQFKAELSKYRGGE